MVRFPILCGLFIGCSSAPLERPADPGDLATSRAGGCPNGRASGVSDPNAIPPHGTAVDVAGVTARDVAVWIALDPSTVHADGTSLVTATAIMTTQSGSPIRGANARFFENDFLQAPDGQTLGGCDEPQVGVAYPLLPSCVWLLPNGTRTNLINVKTGDDGRATAACIVPAWDPAIKDKPQSIGAWFDFDGAGNPVASTLLWLTQP